MSEQTSDNPRDHNHDDDEAAVDPQDQLAADTAAASGTKSGGGTMAAAAAATSGGKGGKEGGRTEVGPEVLRRWFDVLRGHGDLVRRGITSVLGSKDYICFWLMGEEGGGARASDSVVRQNPQ